VLSLLYAAGQRREISQLAKRKLPGRCKVLPFVSDVGQNAAAATK
jgi:hypothetical protein